MIVRNFTVLQLKNNKTHKVLERHYSITLYDLVRIHIVRQAALISVKCV